MKIVSLVFTCLVLSSTFPVGLTASYGIYDPWCDYDADGDIDLYDAVKLTANYGSSGNSTRQVYVTNIEPVISEYETCRLGLFNITSGRFYQFAIPDWNSPVFCGGYSRLTVYFRDEWMSAGVYELTIALAGVHWFNGVPGEEGQYGGPYAYETVNGSSITVSRDHTGWSADQVKPVLIETKAPYFTLAFRTQTDAPDWQAIWTVIEVIVYLRNE